MVNEWLPIFIFMLITAGVVMVIIVGTQLIGPKRPGKIKLDPYESGVEPVGEARAPFSIRFYIIAMLFIIFDLEVVFFYPWAVIYKSFLSKSSFILIEMIVFIGILLIGYIYAWKKGALEWQ
ncbi:MAG: NAD(P)H-quinone oxidoreductase subunit 3 [Calditrichaeota bacterium]|nr:NAD(P)H-quinone oxidoreductase subunit 3 [Calditrichota bacterium]